MLKSPLKFAGGKRWLVPTLAHLLWPFRERVLVEPFCGSAAVSFALWPGKPAVLNDANPDLTFLWSALRSGVDLNRAWPNTPEGFAQVRSEFNFDRHDPDRQDVGDQAARLYWLNRHCYNGLFRYNRRGEFNSPFGRYPKPKYGISAEEAEAYGRAMANWRITNLDFTRLAVTPECVVYTDPPYMPASKTAAFTEYTPGGGFGLEKQRELRDWLQDLTQRGIPWIASNSYTPGVLKLYRARDCTVRRIDARRAINSKASARGPVPEALITPRWMRRFWL